MKLELLDGQKAIVTGINDERNWLEVWTDRVTGKLHWKGLDLESTTEVISK